jgi:hypothetical protein
VAGEVPPAMTFIGGAVILAAIAFQALIRVRQPARAEGGVLVPALALWPIKFWQA